MLKNLSFQFSELLECNDSLATPCEELTHWKRLWCWEGLGAGKKGMTEDEMAGWHYRLGGREFEWTPGDGDGQGGPACWDSWGCQESDTTEQLNWTELNDSLSLPHTTVLLLVNDSRPYTYWIFYNSVFFFIVDGYTEGLQLCFLKEWRVDHFCSFA